MLSKEKKIIIPFFGLILFSVLFLAFFIFVVKSNSLKQAQKEKREPNQSEIFSMAVGSKDESQCHQLSDQDQASLCLSEIKDIMIYDSALKARDIKQCEGIVGQSRKGACLSVIDQLLGYPNADSTSATDLSSTSDEFKP